MLLFIALTAGAGACSVGGLPSGGAGGSPDASAGTGGSAGADASAGASGTAGVSGAGGVAGGSDAGDAADAGGDCGQPVTSQDAGPACNPDASFGTPTELTSLASPLNQIGGSPSADGKHFYFARQESAAAGSPFQIWVLDLDPCDSTGSTNPRILSDISDPVHAASTDFRPHESPDGQRLYFFSYRAPSTPGWGGAFISARSADGGWQAPQLYADSYQTGVWTMYPIPGAIYVAYSINGNYTLMRQAVDGAGNIGAPVDQDPDGGAGINTGGKAVQDVVVTPDELHLYFSSPRSGSYQSHIFESDRASKSDPWGQPYMLPQGPGKINAPTSSETQDVPEYVSADNCTLYYTSAPTGLLMMYKATRTF